MTTLPFTHTPGAATAVCAGRLAALLALDPGHELVAGVQRVLAGEQPSLDDVLDVLVSLGLRTVERFAIAEATDAGVRVVVRGGWTAEVPGAEPVVGEGLWVDRFLDGATSVLLSGPDAVGPALPLAGGVVLAGRVGLVAPVAQVVAVDLTDPEPPAVTRQPAADVVAPELTADVPEPEAAPVTVESEAAAVSDEDSRHDFDHLFGATQVPAEPDEEPEPEPSHEPGAGPAGVTMASPFTAPLPDLPPEPAPVPSVPAAPIPPVPAVPGGFIAAVPWALDVPADAPPAAPAAPLTPTQPPPQSAAPSVPEPPPIASQGPPEMTIARDQLAGAVAPLVVAARCAEGHLSPAYAGACRVCGRPLPAQQPFEAPRPSLGVLRLSTGDTVTLDRGAILGRHPRLPQGWAGEQPNLVRIDDPDRDVSSQHLEIRLDFWHVLVRDLGSTNGTEVILPGAAPVALRPHDAMAIEPGTKVVLAGVFDFTFEVTG